MKKRKKHKQPQPAQAGGQKVTVSGPTTASQAPVAAALSGAPVATVREIGNEPKAARASIPVLLIVLLVALLYWGDMYLMDHGGELDARVYHPYQNFKEIEDLQPKGEEEILKAKGLLVYGKICSNCHQPDGNGSASQNAPPLAGSEWVLAKDPARIIHIVIHGLSGPIEVLRKEWGAGQMVAWGPVLSDEEIAHVLTYVRSSWGNRAPVVSIDQVKKIRADTKERSSYMTPEDLLKVPLKD